MAGLPSAGEVEAALAGGAGDELGIGDRLLDVLAAGRNRQTRAAERRAQRLPGETSEAPEAQGVPGVTGPGVVAVAVGERAVDDVIGRRHRLIGGDGVAREA